MHDGAVAGWNVRHLRRFAPSFLSYLPASHLVIQDITLSIRLATLVPQFTKHAVLFWNADPQIGIATNTHGSTAYIAVTCETAAHLLLGHLNAYYRATC